MAEDSIKTGAWRYRRILDPQAPTQVPSAVGSGGRGALRTYVWQEDVILAVNVALVTGRALLIRGEPGIGKTSVAEAAAAALNWRFYRHTTTSRTEARDILWRFDAVRRLADAQARREPASANPLELDDYQYLEPRELWWAIDRDGARRRGRPEGYQGAPALEPFAEVNETRSPGGAVVLLDEIDKADPAVANDLLETFSDYRFRVDSVTHPFEVTMTPPASTGEAEAGPSGILIVVTTNEERDLPEAFLRRCIVHHMQWPREEDEAAYAAFQQLVLDVAQAHWPTLSTEPWGPQAEDITTTLFRMIETERQHARAEERRPPGLAEFLDALHTVQKFAISVNHRVWQDIARLVWRKAPDSSGG